MTDLIDVLYVVVECLIDCTYLVRANNLLKASNLFISLVVFFSEVNLYRELIFLKALMSTWTYLPLLTTIIQNGSNYQA